MSDPGEAANSSDVPDPPDWPDRSDRSDRSDLAGLVEAMEQTWQSTLELAEALSPEDWARPTRCPGWDVHDQVAHIVSAEQLLGGGPLPPEAPSAPHIRNEFGAHMERGVHALRGTPPEQLVADLRAVVQSRSAELAAHPPRTGDEILGIMGRPMPAERSLPIRVFDLWTHEQDIRVAVHRPGNESGPGAQVSQDIIVGEMPRLWAKEAGAKPGQTLLLRVTGELPLERAVVVDRDGRAALVGDAEGESASAGAEPTSVIVIDWADLAARACGREGAQDRPVWVDGDEMAQAVLDELPMSP
jgi:uncharacterized protein (TIGR03083 family)